MRALACIAAILTLAWSAPALAAAPAGPDDALDRAFFAAISADPARLELLLADNFLYRTSAGTTIGKPALIDELRSGRTRVAAPQLSNHALAASGKTRVSTGEVTLEVETTSGTRFVRSRFTHVWVRESGRWRLLYRESSIL